MPARLPSDPPAAPARPRKGTATRRTTINIRALEREVAVIDQAAETLGQTRSAFMLERAVQAAEAVLLDQRLFVVGDATYDAFQAALNAPVRRNPELTKLLEKRAPWAR